jgi:hypothetical protein
MLTFYEQVKRLQLDLDIAETTDRLAATGSRNDIVKGFHSIEVILRFRQQQCYLLGVWFWLSGVCF